MGLSFFAFAHLYQVMSSRYREDWTLKNTELSFIGGHKLVLHGPNMCFLWLMDLFYLVVAKKEEISQKTDFWIFLKKKKKVGIAVPRFLW